jgi:hypothetical protein
MSPGAEPSATGWGCLSEGCPEPSSAELYFHGSVFPDELPMKLLD